jgi:hypothetical protein
MLNRIRRAVALARARHAPKGRHRRTLRPSRPPIALVSPASADEPTVALVRPSTSRAIGTYSGARTVHSSVRTCWREKTAPDGARRSSLPPTSRPTPGRLSWGFSDVLAAADSRPGHLSHLVPLGCLPDRHAPGLHGVHSGFGAGRPPFDL